ncbi:hypothetical protein CRX72_27445 [Pantoea sp. BRM17]|nr:hypothetical protein CRX72_27445 [Pantoea sp. BRM17]
MSIEKVAHLAGVSKATVSRVLNQHPGVRPDTRSKVALSVPVLLPARLLFFALPSSCSPK